MDLSDLPEGIVERVEYEQYRVIVKEGKTRRTKMQRPRSKWLEPWWRGKQSTDIRREGAWELWTTGGKVVCRVVLKTGKVFTGVMWCSMSETFSYNKRWKDAALGRAVRDAKEWLEHGPTREVVCDESPHDIVSVIYGEHFMSTLNEGGR